MLGVLPHFVEKAALTRREICRILSESFFMVKGAALFLQQGGSAQGPKTPTHHKHAGDLPQHLQVMFKILRSEDRIKLAVRLESGWSDRVRYMVVIYTNGHQETEENIVLGMDFTDKDSKMCSIGMVLPLWSDSNIHLDGDGGFSVNTAGRSHVFKPVSVQAMWSALQVLHKACEVSRRFNYFQGGIALTWMAFYESGITSEQSCINEWNAMTDLDTARSDSPTMFADRPTERERTECLIKAKLRSIMTFQDLENITSKEIRNKLEQHMSCNLTEYKEFIDNEMLLILGQMDKPTLIFDHVYLGSEWNASNLEELRECGVGYILNVTREIDNFFPGMFSYHNVRVYDEDATDLLAHWNDTYNFMVKAKKSDSKCLVHCKMGVSRSASSVIAYAMKEYGWSLEKAYNYVKQKRSIAQPNAGFMRQLAEYEGILDASKHRHNRLWRPGSDKEGSDDLQGSGHCTGGERTPVPRGEEAMGACGASPCRAVGLEMEPLDSLNYNYYFRRLSDSALDSEPSTPVRGPPLLGMERVFIEIDDVERDALLEDEGFPMAHLALPGEGTAAQTCGRLDPLEDMRLRLEISTLEEEDEEEAKKEEAEMAALAQTPGNSDGKEESRLGLANLNTNNSNRLAAKRSCPAAFDDSGSTGNPLKVKPSYQSCKDCLRVPQVRRCDRPAGGRSHRLNPSRHCTIPTICIDPPGTNFASTPILQSLQTPAVVPPHMIQPSRHLYRCSTCTPGGPLTNRQKRVSPMSCEETPPDRSSVDTEDMDEPQGEEISKDTTIRVAPAEGLDLHRGGAVGLQQQALAQLHMPGLGIEFGLELMRQRAEQLEKLPSLAMEGQLPVGPLP
ncbi:protein phosphatase Slingshot homolog 1 isoform X2 [Pseudoliparis swirei]|uniref:protein phosphatase Slingshot homolog 1 isoform X2 n=1 Tax=Pseudoliparis swirei TaxID=2059687 RepID=UPI0024BD9BF0|nr:protein phosphatase Slingshot homolog 1 isoform X2 [Pseudoliparis swirei]